MESKKLNLQEVAERLKNAFAQKGLSGYVPEGRAIMNLNVAADPYHLAVSLTFTNGVPAETQVMLYFPAVHEIVTERAEDICDFYQLFPYCHSKKKKIYGPHLMVEISEDEDGHAVFTQYLRPILNRPLPQSSAEAEAFLNARFLMSSDSELVDRAWLPDKVLKPYIWEGTVGYCYQFEDQKGQKQTWLVNSSCERIDDVPGMVFLTEPKLMPLGKGYVYFDGNGFFPRKSKYLDKDEIRSKFKILLKEYPNAVFYGHLIPVYYLSQPFWLVGIQRHYSPWFVLISPETEEIKLVNPSTIQVAPPDDEVFFGFLKSK